MNSPIELSMEQQFSIFSFRTQVEKMSHEQAQDFLIQMYEHMIKKEAMYKQFLKLQWGIEAPPQFSE